MPCFIGNEIHTTKFRHLELNNLLLTFIFMHRILTIIALFIVFNATSQVSIKMGVPVTWLSHKIEQSMTKSLGYEIGLAYEHELKESLKLIIGGNFGYSKIKMQSIYIPGGKNLTTAEQFNYIEFPVGFKLNIKNVYLLAGSSMIIPFKFNSSTSVNGGIGVTMLKKIAFDVKYSYYFNEVNFTNYNLNKLNFTLGYIIRNSRSAGFENASR